MPGTFLSSRYTPTGTATVTAYKTDVIKLWCPEMKNEVVFIRWPFRHPMQFYNSCFQYLLMLLYKDRWNSMGKNLCSIVTALLLSSITVQFCVSPRYFLTLIYTYLVTYLLTYSLTHSMEQSHSWEANRFAVSQEIPRILWNLKVLPHSQVPATCLYPEPAQSSPYPHVPHLNIILPSTPGPPQWYLSLRFLHQKLVQASPLPIRAKCPAYLIILDLPLIYIVKVANYLQLSTLCGTITNIYIYIYIYIYISAT
jgi:hypothetical protein